MTKEADYTLDAATEETLAGHGKQPATLVLASAADFFGEKAEAKPDPDQASLAVDPADKPVFDNTDAGQG